MPLYERIASALIGTPLQRPAERLRELKGLPHRLRHPELREIYLEDQRIEQLLRAAVSEGMNCIDAGCHLGSILQKIVRLAPHARHSAIEPVPYKAAWLRRKFPGVEVHQLALGDEVGEVEFFYDRGNSACSGLRADGAHQTEKLRVKCASLDVLVPCDRAIGFLKLDVEGGEYAALRGAARILAESRPLVLFECTRSGLANFGRAAGEVHSLLTRDLAYDVFFIKDWLCRGAPLGFADFEASMRYPFKAFNYVAAPRP
jgi:FkbM family methyltransferase